jgi:hypothetical protein
MVLMLVSLGMASGCAAFRDAMHPPPPVPDATGKLTVTCQQSGYDPQSWDDLCDLEANQICEGRALLMRTSDGYSNLNDKVPVWFHQITSVYQCIKP